MLGYVAERLIWEMSGNLLIHKMANENDGIKKLF